MNLPTTDVRVCSSLKQRGPLPSGLLILLLMLCVGSGGPASAQQQPLASPTVAKAPLNTAQVVQNLVRMNLERAKALRSYQGTRTYRVVHHGFPGTRSAEMVVKAKYQSPGTKEFVIQSATGSKLIIDKVFKKLLEAEKEASVPEYQRHTALTEDNYRFTLVGYEAAPSGAMYVLSVEPLTKDKYLYRGRIWVDAADFVVVKLEAEPAKNPSIWTKKTEILQVYKKVSDFWLPAQNHSVTAIRLGGRAELTIDYEDYEITGASSVNGLAGQRATPHDETAHARQ